VDNLCLAVSELFYSIQGESTRAGMPCAFIRLSECNLRCSYCDSSFTWEEPGQRMSLHDIRQWVENYPEVMVELTGGEPLLQDNIYPLVDTLIADGRTVLIETNGSLAIDRVPAGASVILDIKCPDSGMADRMEWGNIDILRSRREKHCRDEVKFVLSSEQDYRWALKMIGNYRLAGLVPLLFSPVESCLDAARLAEMMLADRVPARLQLQLHRILWPNKNRGV